MKSLLNRQRRLCFVKVGEKTLGLAAHKVNRDGFYGGEIDRFELIYEYAAFAPAPRPPIH